MTPEAPKTLLDAVRYYTDPKVTFQTMIAVKWPDGNITCPKCGGNQIGVIGSRSLLQCKAKDCRKQFSVKVNTIFEDSPLGLDKWFVAVWCIANAKNGISSHELGRALGVTQKTAWFMLHRIRAAMKTRSFRKLSGEVEGDETFIGGKARPSPKNQQRHRIGHTRTIDGDRCVLVAYTANGRARYRRLSNGRLFVPKRKPDAKRRRALPLWARVRLTFADGERMGVVVKRSPLKVRVNDHSDQHGRILTWPSRIKVHLCN